MDGLSFPNFARRLCHLLLIMKVFPLCQQDILEGTIFIHTQRECRIDHLESISNLSRSQNSPFPADLQKEFLHHFSWTFILQSAVRLLPLIANRWDISLFRQSFSSWIESM